MHIAFRVPEAPVDITVGGLRLCCDLTDLTRINTDPGSFLDELAEHAATLTYIGVMHGMSKGEDEQHKAKMDFLATDLRKRLIAQADSESRKWSEAGIDREIKESQEYRDMMLQGAVLATRTQTLKNIFDAFSHRKEMLVQIGNGLYRSGQDMPPYIQKPDVPEQASQAVKEAKARSAKVEEVTPEEKEEAKPQKAGRRRAV
jgi:hypothetical protein